MLIQEAGVVRGADAQTLLEGRFGAILLAGAEQTGGSVSLVVHPLAPRTLGAPLHTHRNEDEWSFVLEGTIGVQVGVETRLAHAGDAVLKPRGLPHAFWNASEEPARMLEVITPGGFEGYFAALNEVFAAEVPDLALLASIAARYDLEVDPTSVPRLAAEHGLVLV